MPNWCDNTVYISHEDPKKIQILVDAWKANKFFGTIYPEPDYTKVKVEPMFPEIKGNNDPVSPESAWWDWRVRNWGTKWEVASDDYYEPIVEGETSLKVSFSTAWSPPTGIYDRLVNDGYSVDAYYYESGCAFCGHYSDGNDETYGIDGNWEWVRNNIPDQIDNEFCISESMKEWAMEQLADEIRAIESEIAENQITNSDTHKLIDELNTKKKELEEMENG